MQLYILKIFSFVVILIRLMWLEQVETQVLIDFVIIFVKLPLKDKASVHKDAVAKQKSLSVSVLFYFF